MFPQFTNQNRCVGISCECGFDIYLGVQTYANKLTRIPRRMKPTLHMAQNGFQKLIFEKVKMAKIDEYKPALPAVVCF